MLTAYIICYIIILSTKTKTISEVFEMENKPTFSKRIALTKKEVFELVQKENLEKAGNTRSGYYPIKVIMSALNPTLDKYDLDVEVLIAGTGCINCIWIDCLSDKTRSVPIELKPIHEIERLAGMQNIVQSQGGVMTYYRRYALTNLLNLNATDLIENSTGKNHQDKVNKQQKPSVLVNQDDLKKMFTLMTKKNITIDSMEKSIKKQYNLDDNKQLTKTQYNQIMSYLNSIEMRA